MNHANYRRPFFLDQAERQVTKTGLNKKVFWRLAAVAPRLLGKPSPRCSCSPDCKEGGRPAQLSFQFIWWMWQELLELGGGAGGVRWKVLSLEEVEGVEEEVGGVVTP